MSAVLFFIAAIGVISGAVGVVVLRNPFFSVLALVVHLVSLAVLILRRTQPNRPRGFRVPFVPVLPILSMLCCLVLMAGLTLENWIRFFVWLIIGLVIYFAYSRKRSVLGIEERAGARL